MREQGLFLNGAWVAGVDTFEVRDPFDESLVGRVAVASPEQAAEAVVAARERDADRLARRQAGRPAAADQPADRRAVRAVRRTAAGRGRQAHRRGPRRGGPSRLDAAHRRGGGTPASRRGRAVRRDHPGRHAAGLHDPPAVRGRRRDHPVQLPAQPGAAQGGPGHRSRLRGRPQAVGADTAVRGPAGRDHGRGRAATRLAQRRHRPAGGDRADLERTSRCRRDHLHRIGRGGMEAQGGLAAQATRARAGL